jgi:hypothetical protein
MITSELPVIRSECKFRRDVLPQAGPGKRDNTLLYCVALA